MKLYNEIKLNISEVVMQAPVSAPAAAQPAETADAPAAKAAEQSTFKVTLAKFDTAQKAKVIKEIKQLLPGANLVEVSYRFK